MHVIVMKAVCFKALSDDFKIYTKNVINNAKILSERLKSKGFKIFSGGTDTHHVIRFKIIELLEKMLKQV